MQPLLLFHRRTKPLSLLNRFIMCRSGPTGYRFIFYCGTDNGALRNAIQMRQSLLLTQEFTDDSNHVMEDFSFNFIINLHYLCSNSMLDQLQRNWLANHAENCGPRTVCNHAEPSSSGNITRTVPYVLRTVWPDAGKAACHMTSKKYL